MKGVNIMKKNVYLIPIIVAIVVGAAAFFGGMKYQESRQPSGRQFANGQGARGQFGGGNAAGRNGFRPVAGEIIASDDSSITVKLQDGSSKIVFLSKKTSINKADTAQKTDLKTGEKVAVFGTDNSDGSVTAQTIQLNPMDRRLMNNGRPTPNK